MDVEASSPAEQNHWSLKATAGDDATRPLEQNIVDVMERSDLVLQKKQKAKDKWATEAENYLSKIQDWRCQAPGDPRETPADATEPDLFVSVTRCDWDGTEWR